jgi:hypothetical protein
VSRFFAVKRWQALLTLAALEILAVGAGMGVPIFAILLGFPIGWWLARRHALGRELTKPVLTDILMAALVASLMTFGLMIAIWAPQFSLLDEPGFDAAKWGIPLILYTSRASFFGWMALMIVISPVLQLLATVFAAYVTLLAEARR